MSQNFQSTWIKQVFLISIHASKKSLLIPWKLMNFFFSLIYCSDNDSPPSPQKKEKAQNIVQYRLQNAYDLYCINSCTYIIYPTFLAMFPPFLKKRPFFLELMPFHTSEETITISVMLTRSILYFRLISCICCICSVYDLSLISFLFFQLLRLPP